MTRKQPPYFKVYEEEAKLLQSVPDELAGRLIKAACTFHLNGEVTEFDDALEQATFNTFLEKIARGHAEYIKTCEQNREKAKKRWNV